MKRAKYIKRNVKNLLLSIILFTQYDSYAQTDTAAVIKEFAKVMAFSSQPDIYYNTSIKMTAVPVMQPQDTMSTNGVFYKHGESVYAKNGNDETFMQDGFLLQVNSERKSIWISKTDEHIKEELTQKTITKQLETLFRKKYNIGKSSKGSVASISFDTRPSEDNSSEPHSKVSLQYDTNNFLPKAIGIEMNIKEEADEELKDAFKAEGVNMTELVQKIDGKEFFVRTQKMTLSFDNISTAAAAVQNMPSWKTCVEYDDATQSYKGKGAYSEYEVTKLF